MKTPEIEHSNISFWWIWRNMGLDAALSLAVTTGRKCRQVSDERMAEILVFFDSVEDDDGEKMGNDG